MKKFIVTILIILLTLIVIFLFFSIRAQSTNLLNLSDSDNVYFKFDNTILNLEVARSSQKQEYGLMNRTNISVNSGMLFIFDDETQRNFWMKNTLISLDIIYLDKNLKVVQLYKSTRPNQTLETYSSKIPSQFTIEVNSGWSENHNLKIGDKFTLN